MQIDIHGGLGVDLTDKVRAYVEYRMFSAASRFEGDGARVSVRLERAGTPARALYRCVAVVGFGADARVLVSATAVRLQAAVDRVAEKLSARVERRLAAAAGTVGTNGDGSRSEPADPGAGRETRS